MSYPEFSHTQGISNLVQARGPETFNSGVLHQLFTSFRVFMVLGAIQQRKETFLDEPRWKMESFATEPKSLMQSLLDEVSGLPSLLQRLDAISRSTCELKETKVACLYRDFLSQIARLKDWQARLNPGSDSNLLWWPIASPSDNGTAFPISYGFANILMANTLSHYWGFLLIVQISIETLRIVSAGYGIDLIFHSRKDGVELSQDKMVERAKDTCKSMQYHLQPEMKLYGPAATLFPINIALQVFRGVKMMKEAAWCEDFIVRLGRMGVRLAPHVPLIEKNKSGT
ncbi:hypothetical protein B0J14DRAFT_621671 [Halenospora varia]|nr:hypothetical protein B0J14DRAFT_621671 [Halenospora varia]